MNINGYEAPDWLNKLIDDSNSVTPTGVLGGIILEMREELMEAWQVMNVIGGLGDETCRKIVKYGGEIPEKDMIRLGLSSQGADSSDVSTPS